MEMILYNTSLVIAAIVNFMIAIVLLHNNVWYRNYDVYHRSRIFLALNYTIFGVGFLLHAYFGWRVSWPAAASALTITYFHCGGILFSWSHTPLMDPGFLTRHIVIRDLIILALGMGCYWSAAIAPLADAHGDAVLLHSKALAGAPFLIFFLHAAYITYTFYRTYFKMHRSIKQMPTGGDAPKWWTPETKSTVLDFHHSFVQGCHLIVFFGLGSVALTAAFPRDLWPYVILLATGAVVFIYIFYSLVEYGYVIESGTNATEDAR